MELRGRQKGKENGRASTISKYICADRGHNSMY
jgi:hypothetical protein